LHSEVAIKYSGLFSRFTVPLVFLIAFQVISILFLGLEIYQVTVVATILFFAIPVILNPFWGLLLLLFVTMGIEGRIVEDFILFRLVGSNWYIIDLILFFVMISLFFNGLSGKLTIKLDSMLFWLLFLFLALIVSIFVGMKNSNGFVHVFHDFRSFFYYLIFFPTFFVLKEKKYLRYLFWSMIVFASAKCLIDSYLSLFVYPNTYDSATRLVLNFARLTGYSDVVYPLLVVASIVYFFITDSINKRLFLIPVILISLLATFLSYTRGAWLGVMVALAIFFILIVIRFRDRIKFIHVFTFIITSTFFLTLLDISGFFSISTLVLRATSVSASRIDTSNLGRLLEWATALKFFSDNPWTGGGLGLHVSYFAPGMGHKNTIFIHNSYIYVLAKVGLLGIIPFMGLLLSNLTSIFGLLKSNLSSEEEKITFTFLMILIFLMVKALTTWHLNMWSFTPFIGMLFGIIYSYKVERKIE